METNQESVDKRCRAVFDYECPNCGHPRKGRSACSIFKGVLEPFCVHGERNPMMESVAEKLFINDRCKGFKEK